MTKKEVEALIERGCPADIANKFSYANGETFFVKTRAKTNVGIAKALRKDTGYDYLPEDVADEGWFVRTGNGILVLCL